MATQRASQSKQAAPAPRPASPKPAPATPARATGGPPALRLTGAPAQSADAAPGVLELKGMTEFKPPAPFAEFLDANKTSTVNARFGNLAQGPIQVRTVSKGKYKINEQPLPLTHPAFARVAEFAGGLGPALIIRVADSKVDGQVGLAAGEKIEKIERHIQKTPEILGLAGFTIGTLPKPINTIQGGSLHLGLKGVPIKLGPAFSGTFNFEVIDTSVAFDGNAIVAVKGLANGALELKRAADGSITGKAAVALTLPKNFSGSIDVAWDGVSITGMGKVGYKGEKFSGEVTLQLMEKNQAEQLAAAKKAPEGAAPKPGAAAPAKKPAKIDYVVFGEGDLAFSFTEWLNGTAHVIVDPKGNVTVIGEIKPQKEFILFEQKDYLKNLFKFEARASYGIPVVGNIFIFANVGMDLFAKLGPAKFYNIVIKGTYSTDPKVAKDFSIQGSLNISAAAGAQLEAQAGFGAEILAHDIKAGAGIKGIAGIKAYAEATPIIGYREKGVEGQDLKGEWFIRGDLEVAAQPFLGLSGDLFVELETPWWSPISDDKWTWPLFSKEWPLGGTMGMLVSVDYVFGSGQLPKFDFKPVEFNSEKFITGMYENKAKSGSGKEVEQKGKWQEKNSAAADPPSKSSPKGNASPGKLTPSEKKKAKRVAGKKSGKPADPNARTKEGKSVKQLQAEAIKKGKEPKGKDSKADQRTDAEKLKDLKDAVAEVQALARKDDATPKSVQKQLPGVKKQFRLTVLLVTHESVDKFEVHAEINPALDGPLDLPEVGPLEDKLRSLRFFGSAPKDIGKISKRLREAAEGTAVAAYIMSGKFDAIPGYKDTLSQIKNNTQIPSVLMALSKADELLKKGFTRLHFEPKTTIPKVDVDLAIVAPDGSWSMAYQFKRITGKIEGLVSTVHDYAETQMDNAPAKHKWMVIIVPNSKKSDYDALPPDKKFSDKFRRGHPTVRVKVTFGDGATIII